MPRFLPAQPDFSRSVYCCVNWGCIAGNATGSVADSVSGAAPARPQRRVGLRQQGRELNTEGGRGNR
jgi:hypothetical protein